MPTMRRKPAGLTNRGTAYTGWHQSKLWEYGDRWWESAAIRRQIAIEGNKDRGPRFNAGVSVGRIGVKFHIKAEELDARLKQLPEKMALTIQRKGVKKGLKVWEGTLRVLFGRHRTDFARPHLADHVATVSRVYRRGRHRLVWGAVGIRKGAASGKQIERAVKSTQAHGIDARGSYRGTFSDPYFRELPGWRLHFLESGAYRRRRNGVQYFRRVMDMQGPHVSRIIAEEIRRLVEAA